MRRFVAELCSLVRDYDVLENKVQADLIHEWELPE